MALGLSTRRAAGTLCGVCALHEEVLPSPRGVPGLAEEIAARPEGAGWHLPLAALVGICRRRHLLPTREAAPGLCGSRALKEFGFVC